MPINIVQARKAEQADNKVISSSKIIQSLYNFVLDKLDMHETKL